MGGVAFAFAVAGGVEIPFGMFSAAGEAMARDRGKCVSRVKVFLELVKGLVRSQLAEVRSWRCYLARLKSGVKTTRTSQAQTGETMRRGDFYERHDFQCLTRAAQLVSATPSILLQDLLRHHQWPRW